MSQLASKLNVRKSKDVGIYEIVITLLYRKRLMLTVNIIRLIFLVIIFALSHIYKGWAYQR